MDNAPAFAPRHAPLVLDESSQVLGMKNLDDNDYNRIKITQRDLGSLSVIGSLTKVEHGKWADQNACLIAFRFQFHKGHVTAFRFSEADIVIELQARPPGDPNNDPAVLRYGPKFLRLAGTPENLDWHYTASLSASAGVSGVEASPTVEFGRSGDHARQYAAVVESDDWGNRKHRRPNCVKIWMREGDRQGDGIPLELLAAVVVQTNGSFQANVSVKVDSIFNLIAWPWSKDDPLLLEPGVNFGPSLRQTTSTPDFSTIAAEEWRQLVTPDLHFRGWEPRFRRFSEDGGKSTLGQHNIDDSSTRTKITHVEFLGLGVVGSVCSVAYGTWSNTPAALVVMQFDFRAGDGYLRFKKAEVTISFAPQRAADAPPVVRRFHPTKNKLQSEPSESQSAGFSTKQLVWPPDEFAIRGKTWVGKGLQEPNEVIWTLNETYGGKFGICEPVKLAVVVTFHGPFTATVDVSATVGVGLKLCNFPWSRDDPLLFDQVTCRGRPPLESEFSKLNDQHLIDYISSASPSSSGVLAASRAAAQDGAPPSTKPEMKGSSTSRPVYRAQGIPGPCLRVTFVKSLAAALHAEPSSIRVHSFTANPYRVGDEMMSILSFDPVPEALQTKSPKREWTVTIPPPSEETESRPIASTTTIHLLLDTHFLGFSGLGTSCAASSQIELDIIAVHGLGGHAYGSFKERGGSYMWLEDALPAKLRTAWEPSTRCLARVLTYGYDAHIENSDSFQSIHDLASRLRASLRTIRRGEANRRPMVFIGHSLGGLIIKELLLLLSNHDADESDRFNLNATGGALFFGVPNRGMDNSALLSVIGSQPNREFLASMRVGSPELEKQSNVFCEISTLAGSVIFCFYETCVSGTAKMEAGKLTMNGTPAILVDKDSATHAWPWQKSSRVLIPINRSHMDMVKFERYSDDYERTLGCLQELVQKTKEVAFEFDDINTQSCE